MALLDERAADDADEGRALRIAFALQRVFSSGSSRSCRSADTGRSSAAAWRRGTRARSAPLRSHRHAPSHISDQELRDHTSSGAHASAALLAVRKNSTALQMPRSSIILTLASPKPSLPSSLEIRTMFALSQTTSYALLALSCLARHEGAWHLVGTISGCIGVAPPYLAKVLHRLARPGLIETKRGYKGGYRLARPAATIRLLDVIRAVDDQRVEDQCMLGMSQCSDERACPVHGFWKDTRRQIRAQLEEITLADLSRFEDFRRLRCDALQTQLPAERAMKTGAKEARTGRRPR